MDASQYKDYVLTLLFVKYVSDKYAGKPNSLIEIPAGGGFADLVGLKGDKEIGDKINKAIGKLAEANCLKGVIDVADFNDEDKLGKGKEMQDRLSSLGTVTIRPSLSFVRMARCGSCGQNNWGKLGDGTAWNQYRLTPCVGLPTDSPIKKVQLGGSSRGASTYVLLKDGRVFGGRVWRPVSIEHFRFQLGAASTSWPFPMASAGSLTFGSRVNMPRRISTRMTVLAMPADTTVMANWVSDPRPTRTWARSIFPQGVQLKKVSTGGAYDGTAPPAHHHHAGDGWRGVYLRSLRGILLRKQQWQQLAEPCVLVSPLAKICGRPPSPESGGCGFTCLHVGMGGVRAPEQWRTVGSRGATATTSWGRKRQTTIRPS